jgi:hypothetical protein
MEMAFEDKVSADITSLKHPLIEGGGGTLQFITGDLLFT